MPVPVGTSVPSLASLLQLADSALPTGAFSQSFGLEVYLESGEVHDEATLLAWLEGYLSTQLTFTDAIAVRRAVRIAEGGSNHAEGGSRTSLAELDAELTAVLLPAEIRRASQTMGRRLLEIAGESFAPVVPVLADVASYAADAARGVCAGHYSIAFALAGAGQGLDEETLVEAYVYSALTSLTYNAIRAIPLGQLAGQRVLGALRARVPHAVVRSKTPDERLFGAAAPALEIHQMRHEHQRARMFVS
ncbi:urease accessory protein UreF [Sinomonas cyclohexanicum]|uniref:Urease accessory protein UreF n=1 Tax=Sinomonas cyclohexanicum TaxID=322009 RepID=A0ABN6FFL0_SINCY|nr:urease accessory protein UreF [Corynebacterium cyclohexanicum]BCT75175.1 urease accessory protein UreF [Corynebacterium cyclohexanicum]